MSAISKTILTVLVGCTFTITCAVSSSAVAKDPRRLCGASTTVKVQGCGKLVAKAPVKIPAKKPGTDKGKGLSPGAILLLQLLL